MLRPGDVAPPFDVHPVFGLPVRTGSRPLIVLFVRPLSGGLARAALAEADKALPEVEAAGGSIVAFTVADLTLARDVVPRNHVLVPVIVEGTFARFEAWGLGRDRGLARSMLAIPDAMRALRSALPFGRAAPTSGVDRLPGWFALDAGGVVTHAHYASTIWEIPSREALCAALHR